MTRIAVDIDDTLYSFTNLAREKFVDYAIERGEDHLKRGAYCAWVEWRSPADVISLDYWMEIIRECHRPEIIREQVPYKGAVETLWELVRGGYDLTYITDRSPEAGLATAEWLYDCDFPIHTEARDGEAEGTCDGASIKFLCGHYSSKAPYLHDCQYIIDDRPKNLVDFIYDFNWKHRHGSTNAEMARKGFGIFGEYNRGLTDIPGVYLAPNWKLLRQYMIEHGVLDAPLPV